MQNKPNFLKAKMKLNFYLTKDYENQGRLQTQGKQTQSNPIFSELVEPISKAKKSSKKTRIFSNSGQFQFSILLRCAKKTAGLS